MKNRNASDSEGANYIVQKSDPLLFLEEMIPYTLPELKLIDIYLSRINAFDEGTCIITIPLKEYMNLLGLKEMRISALEESLDALSSKKIYIPEEYGFVYNPKHKAESNRIPLFKRVSLATNEDGSREIEFVCNEDVNDIFFNMDKNHIHFVQYVVKNTLRLKSVYSVFLYIHLKSKEYKHGWTISVNELKKDWLRIKPKSMYDDFKYFNHYILKRTVAEINEKTDINVTYDCIKDGHTVTDICFSIESSPESIADFTGEPSLDCREERSDNPKEKGGNPPTRYVEGNNNVPQKQQSQPQQKTAVRKVYAKEFEEFWKAYPRREDKAMAYEKYNACINAGYRADELLTAAERYAAQCQRNHTEQRYIKMARTFLGPNHPFEEFLDTVVKEEDTELTEEELEEKERLDEFLKTRIKLKVPDGNNGGQEEQKE